MTSSDLAIRSRLAKKICGHFLYVKKAAGIIGRFKLH
jgi:hypothetical protein